MKLIDNYFGDPQNWGDGINLGELLIATASLLYACNMMCLQLLTVVLLWLWLFACGISGEKTPLHFSYITTKTGSFVISGAIPVVDLALEQINSRTDILPNYTLSYTTILDSKVDQFSMYV